MSRSLLVDKNIVQRLAELPKVEYDQVLAKLTNRFALVFPFVLIEEIWTNRCDPRGKSQSVIENMVDIVSSRRSSWMQEETEMIFQELVIHKRTPQKLMTVSDELFQHVVACGPGTPGIAEFLAEREAVKEETLRQRRELQDRIVPRGNFIQVESELEFIRIIRQYLFSTDPEEVNAIGYLTDCALILKSRPQHRNWTKRIKRGFHHYIRCPRICWITTACVLAGLLYAYLPVYRINDGTRHGRPILDRSEQFNNEADQRYVASALICRYVVTQDRDMARLMRFLKACGFWKGDVFETKGTEPIAEQLLAFAHS